MERFVLLLLLLASSADATTLSDNFNRADGAIGSSAEGWAWNALGGTYVIVSNAAAKTGAGTAFDLCRAESNLASADHYAQITVTDTGADTAQAPICRFNASAATGYVFYNYSGTATLAKVVAGSPTAIDTASHTKASGEVYRVEANGSTIRGLIDGVEFCSVTDTDITGNLRCGIMQYGTSGTGTIDDFEAGDLAVTDARPQVIISRAAPRVPSLLDPRYWIRTENLIGIAP